MRQALQIASIILVAVGMALSLAHALELPGKLRLAKETYLAVQPIYYPGFTIGGLFGEGGAMLATLALLIFTPFATRAFWLTLAAFAALLIMHGVYWVITHPVNNFWLRDQHLRGASARFFSAGSRPLSQDWTTMRDQWEYSHVARAMLSMLSLIALVTAAVIYRS